MKPLRAGMLVYCLLYSWSMGQEDPDLESSFSGFPENYTKMLLEHLNNVVGLDSDNVHTKSESTVIPQFLLDLYDCWQTGTDNRTELLNHCKAAMIDEEWTDENALPPEMEKADTVISFWNEGGTYLPPKDFATDEELGPHISLHFTSTCININPFEVIMAQYRIFKSRTNSSGQSLLETHECVEEDGITLNLWIGQGETPDHEIVKLIQTKVLRNYQEESWVLFKNLQNNSSQWFNNTSSCNKSHSLYLTLGGNCKDVDPRAIGFNGPLNSQPSKNNQYFSLFYNDTSNMPLHHRVVESLDEGESTISPNRPKRSTVKPVDNRNYYDQLLRQRSLDPCAGYDFKVTWEDLNWQDMAVLPLGGFKTKYCTGTCNPPLNNNNNTLHAVIQALAHRVYPDVPLPCCAPKSLSPFAAVLIVDNVVKVKRIPQLIVDKCACL